MAPTHPPAQARVTRLSPRSGVRDLISLKWPEASCDNQKSPSAHARQDHRCAEDVVAGAKLPARPTAIRQISRRRCATRSRSSSGGCAGVPSPANCASEAQPETVVTVNWRGDPTPAGPANPARNRCNTGSTGPPWGSRLVELIQVVVGRGVPSAGGSRSRSSVGAGHRGGKHGQALPHTYVCDVSAAESLKNRRGGRSARQRSQVARSVGASSRQSLHNRPSQDGTRRCRRRYGGGVTPSSVRPEAGPSRPRV
jgi:hypothetical protein